MWKVNAGRRSALADEFLARGAVAIGWSEAGDYTQDRTAKQLFERIARAYPDDTERQTQVGAAQIWRFLHEMKLGDCVITYEPARRFYHLGVVTGEPVFRPEEIKALPVQRAVKWQSHVSRDDLSSAARGRLGAILTLFKVAESAAEELCKLSRNEQFEGAEDPDEEVGIGDLLDPFEGLEDQALERVKDRLLALDWEQMQEIVASLLRALGYRTLISPAGPDRGKDIIASKDGFGFERPRIVVEVKHRRGQMGAQEIRGFLGGRHSDDRGLYVSTGGFTREAHYEAERASTVTHLMSLDELARSLIQQYDALDQDGRRLLPLAKIYWPL